MKFFKCLDVKSPNRGTKKSAGIDFYIPNNTEEFITKFKDKNSCQIDNLGIHIPPHERVNIPSGIKADVPNGYALIAYNKSGVSLRYGLDVGATVVDEDYQGEIHISLVNTSNSNIDLNFGEKIVQFILIPVFYDNLVEVSSELECFDSESERGSGAFGSTGTN